MKEKIALLNEAYAYALKENRVCESNLYPSMYDPEEVSKEVMEFMVTFHTLDAFVIGARYESSHFGCDRANHWTVQVGFSESTPDIWQRKSVFGESDAYAVVTYNYKGVRKIRVFNICAPLAEVYANLYLNPTETSIYRSKFESSKGVITDE
jgi:hypothetical protein